jgi:hypothetical protein
MIMANAIRQILTFLVVVILWASAAHACPGCKDAVGDEAAQTTSASSDVARPTPVRFESGLYVMLAGTAAAMIGLAAVIAMSLRARE